MQFENRPNQNILIGFIQHQEYLTYILIVFECTCLQTYKLVLILALDCFHMHKRDRDGWHQHLLQIMPEFLKLSVSICILSVGKKKAHSLLKQPATNSFVSVTLPD